MSQPLHSPGIPPLATESGPPAGGHPQAKAVPIKNIDRSLVGGVAWTGVAKAGGQTIAWLSTIVVARLLSPDDYGIMGMAMLYLGLLQLVTEFGIGATVVNHHDLTKNEVEQLNTVSLGIGVVGTLVVMATSPLVAYFFHNPRLTPVLVALSITFLISSLKSVPWGLLQRDFQFKRLAIYDGLQATGLAILTVALAWAGFRYWTLVIAAIASTLAGTLLALTLHAVPFARPDFRRLRKSLRFSSNIVVQRITWYGYSNADFLVGGRVLGSVALGTYTLAWDISHVMDKVTMIVQQVTPSVFAKVQHDPAALRRYLVRITEMLGITAMPAMIGLALVAPEFIRVVLSPKWAGMTIALQILCAYGAATVSLPLMAQLLNASGHESFASRNNMLQLIVMPPAFVAGAWYGGVTGLALAWVIVHPFIAARLVRYTLRAVDLSPQSFFRDAIWPGLSGCIAMALVVETTRHALPVSVAPIVKLVLEIALGASAYVLTMFLLYGRRLRNILESARALRNNK